MLFTFSSIPPIKGFSSLIAYNLAGYLIPNSIDRHSLGDRSNLTFPDGTPLYVDGVATKDGSFQILLESTPPSNESWVGNWLPGPVGGGDLTVSLSFMVLRPGRRVMFTPRLRWLGRYKWVVEGMVMLGGRMM